MGECYYLTNHTRGQRVMIGKFCNEWAFYIAKLGWTETDVITAASDQGNHMRYNDKSPAAPEEFEYQATPAVAWDFVVFTAKRMGVEPEDLWLDFLEEDAEEGPTEIVNLGNFYNILEAQQLTLEAEARRAENNNSKL